MEIQITRRQKRVNKKTALLEGGENDAETETPNREDEQSTPIGGTP